MRVRSVQPRVSRLQHSKKVKSLGKYYGAQVGAWGEKAHIAMREVGEAEIFENCMFGHFGAFWFQIKLFQYEIQ